MPLILRENIDNGEFGIGTERVCMHKYDGLIAIASRLDCGSHKRWRKLEAVGFLDCIVTC